MNITPLIDVVFLMIIFFMLVNKIVSEEQVKMVVPELTDPQTYELGEAETIVVSLAPRNEGRGSNPLDFDGVPLYIQYGPFKRFALDNLEGVTEELKLAKAANPEVEVILRADCAAYFQEVQPVMGAITAAGIGKINLVAFLPDEGPAEPLGDQ